MKVENSSSRPEGRKTVSYLIAAMGVFVVPVSLYVAWPALTHLGGKLI